jgi:TolA-binding protein
MQNVEEQILSYPHLPVEKQREVEAYVETHPEWAALLQDVRALESLTRGGDADPSPDALVKTYVVAQHLHSEKVSPELQDAFRRLEQKMDDDPALRERAEAVRRRLVDAEAAVDPVSHFEELTGHALEPDAADASSPAETTAPSREPAREREGFAPVRAVVDDLLRLPLSLRWAGAVVALLLGTYVVLFAASEASQSPLTDLARVDVSNQVVDNYASTATRSATPSPDTMTADQLYVDALTAVQDARTSTLGLFPSYDGETLDRAERLLTQVLDRTESGSFLALEARFYLGKVHLAQGNVPSARSNFQTVVDREGRLATEARDILDTLQEEYPADGANANQ